MLNAGSIHKSKYHSIGLSIRYVCSDSNCQQKSVELVQSVTLVFNPEIWRENLEKSTISWSVRSMFGIGILSSCPLARSSHIFIDNSNKDLTIDKNLAYTELKNGQLSFDVQEMVELDQTNIIVRYQKSSANYLYPSPVLTATRYLNGYGNEKGEIVTKLTNSGKSKLTVVFYDVIPWYLRLFFHTLKIKQGEKLIDPLKRNLIPGVDRKKPYSMELVIELAPKSTTIISVEFEKSILKWLEYPPDANHGFYVGPSIVAAVLPNRRNFTSLPRESSTFFEFFNSEQKEEDSFIRIFTETILVDLPTPDFSMPYNVICLACTVVALAFGPLHNITTKELVIESEKKETFVSKVLGKIMFWKKKKDEGQAAEESKEDSDETTKENKKDR